jgi:hypothetical protein
MRNNYIRGQASHLGKQLAPVPARGNFFTIEKGEKMRMWMVKPELMCMQHLCGEHNELHKHLPSLKKGYDITKRIDDGQISTADYLKRHDELAEEIDRRAEKRGDKKGGHKSPLNENINDIFKNCNYAGAPSINIKMNQKQIIGNHIKLMDRCSECKNKIQKYFL